MKKLVIAVAALVVVALGFAVFQARRPNLKDRVEAWGTAANRGDKIALATTFLVEPSKEDKEMDPDTAAEVSKAADYLHSELIAFERSLPAEQRNHISSQVKGARKNRPHFSVNLLAGCPEEQFTDIENALGLEVLIEHGMDIAILAGLYEDVLLPEYYQRLADYADSAECKDPDCKAFAKVYRRLSVSVQEGISSLKERTTEFETDLAFLGKPADVVTEYAERWPECFGLLNMELAERISKRLTAYRARYLIAEYRRLGVKTEEDLAEASPEVDPESALKRDMVDGWGEAYHTMVVDGRIVVTSNGPDLTPETADDLKFEE